MSASEARGPAFGSYAAIGDSFTEGMGDERPDGAPRGWADLVAAALAHAAGEPIGYANLAIRGRLLAPILDDQLPAAMALRPQLLSINGGGNDILRPRVSIGAVADRLVAAALSARPPRDPRPRRWGRDLDLPPGNRSSSLCSA